MVCTVVVAVSLLLAVTGSKVVAGAVTVAVLLMVPVALGLTVVVTAKIALAPLFRLTVVLILPLPLAAVQLLPTATGVTTQVQVTPVREAGKVSATAAFVTPSGPLFVTSIV